jgi:hypothetical protein
MATKTLTAPAGGPVPVKIKAGYLDLSVDVRNDVSQAILVLEGDQATLDKITDSGSKIPWSVQVPNQGASSISVGGGSIIIGDGNVQSVSFGGRGGRTVVSGGSVFMSGGRGGRTVINGVDVTDYVREHQGEAGSNAGEVKGRLTLPAGSQLDTDIKDGGIQIQGGQLYGAIELRNGSVWSYLDKLRGTVKVHNGDVTAKGTGSIMAESHNGNVTLDAAAEQTTATSHNGDVRVHAAASIQVMATSHNGDVRVTKAAGTSPQVMASSHNGRVSKP